jgi:two-component system cell cycle response regulator
MKILLADDDHVSRRLLERMLQSNGYDVVTAENGRQAMDELSREDSPRLALLDWMMPELDGLNVCREIRGRADKSYVYILLLTARESADDIVAGLKAGADDYLTKPCNLAELKARLHAGQRILMLEDKLVAAREAMRFEATHDALTSVLSRRAILTQVQNELNLCQQSARPMSLLMCDIDHFKQVNDNHGHLVGDAILSQISRRLVACIRAGDLVGRYGGEEFLILLKDSKHDGPRSLDGMNLDGDAFIRRTEQIGETIRSLSFPTPAGPLSISVSIGAIVIDPLTASVPMELLLARADEALYRAKATGRDRAIFADPLFISPLGDKHCSVPLFPAAQILPIRSLR